MLLLSSLTLLALTLLATPSWADGDLPSKFPTSGGIINSRHNLTQNTLPGGGAVNMNQSRNDYGEVCVYCHTPHGAGLALQAPLWNRTSTTATGTYVTYNTLGTTSLSGTVTTPGPASLTCLSCHDGTVAIDSIINMPGSGAGTYLASQETGTNTPFLDGWNSPYGTTTSPSHSGLNSSGCLVCHTPLDGGPLDVVKGGATDLTVAALGVDFRDDHPIGIPYKTGDPEFNTMTATRGNVRFFDLDGDSKPDKNEIRAYDSGDGFEVECASCHDPHGVEVGTRLPTFLRVSNDESGVCLTCHIK